MISSKHNVSILYSVKVLLSNKALPDRFSLHSPVCTITRTDTIDRVNKDKKTESPFDTLVLLASVAYPLTAVPQIIKVYSRHSAHDLSLLSWVLYAILESIFLVYAIKKHLIPFIIQDSLWVIVYIILIIAIILYG